MEWGFTPEDVRTGKTYYSVAQFRDDLLKEISEVIRQHRGEDEFTRFYSIITVMLCTSLALGKSTDAFVASVKKFFPNKELQQRLTKRELLNQIRDDNKENIDMLKAVIRKRIQDDTAIGIDPGCVTKTITSELMTF